MRLISLTSNKESFHPVEFNPSGLTLIVGVQSNPQEKQRTKTYNGVGKSLIIRLIHFCLGSNKIKEFGAKLEGWTFTLRFSVRDQEYTVTRSCDEQGYVILNGVQKSIAEYLEFMLEQNFVSVPPSHVSFRTLINRFIRPNKGAYEKADEFVPKENDFTKLLNNCYLLGLDTNLVLEKFHRRVEKQEYQEKKGSFEKDEILVDLYKGAKDPDIELAEIDDEAKELEKGLKAFEIADDYHEVKVKADDAAREIRELENSIFLFKNSIANIDSSLKIRPDISKDQVVKAYNEVRDIFNDKVLREIDDVLAFHTELIDKRKKRLTEEKEKLVKKMSDFELKRKDLSKQVDDSLKYLNAHRAIDEYLSLSKKLADLTVKSHRIRDFKNLTSQYSIKIESLNIDINKANVDTEKYINAIEDHLKKLNDTFRGFAKEFYSERQGGISIKNNDGDNQQRFSIQVKLQDDASDGINEVKIFCFDMCLLSLQINHDIRFLFHDSRLYSDMDHRQMSTLFKFTSELSVKDDFQYISSLNQDQLNAIKGELSPEDYKSVIENNIRLELTDASSESKLLGIQVDLSYDD
nr:DUF2326 domain-containing protein [uncultured Bdellovibrio sp.]